MQDYANLGEAILATQPTWLLVYLFILVTVNLGAIFFVAKKTPQGWLPSY